MQAFSPERPKWLFHLVTMCVALAGCSKPEPFVLEFPADVSLGTLSIVEDVNCYTCGTGNNRVGDARGSQPVRLPDHHWFASLEMPRQASHLMRHLRHPSLSRLGRIGLRNSDVKDVDLANLTSIPLRYLDLRDTRITGKGLQHIRAHPEWVHVDLKGCNQLDLKYLAHFKGWTRATIALPYGPADSRRLRASQIICDSQPESVCKTQIR
jgi:hypothetical protein